MYTKDYFKDKNIIITGASSGIGEALVEEFSKLDCRNIILLARRKEKLEAIVNKIGKSNIKFYICDVTIKEKVNELYQKICSEVGDIDIAFLNAGIKDTSIVQNINSKQIEDIFKTNFFGVVYWLESLLVDMQKENRGTIVVTSSLAAFRGLPGNGPYAASKAAISALIESYQIDLMATNIKLILVSPYFVMTEMTDVEEKQNTLIWLTAQKAAQKIIDGVKKGKPHIVFPWYFHLFMYILRGMPSSLYCLFWRLLKREG
ncbi:MAG: SDR family NAD(P)-dependent oxidoreductase [Candidatus Omnitrophota bacterium]|nr:SDR family NAD(P)-dependent oxidoreductase [Candidatus Omnitrophota bacterium]